MPDALLTKFDSESDSGRLSTESNSAITSGNRSVSDSSKPSEDQASENDRQIWQTVPSATYRIQFHEDFQFRQATAIIPYLSALGISHVYSSPFLKSVSGSRHGYDIVDQSALNPDLGTEQDYLDFINELHAHGIGQILDVVPNHMGVDTNDNLWWMDVLENGPSSPYASFFDIDWMPLKPDLANKVLLPVLGDQFGKVLEDGQLVLHFQDGAFFVQYYERRFPISMRTSAVLLNYRLSELQQSLSTSNRNSTGDGAVVVSTSDVAESTSPELMEYQSILTAIHHLPPTTELDPEKISEARREQGVVKRRLRDLCQSSPVVNDFLLETVRQFNGQPGDPASFDRLDELLLSQSYRLAYWRVAADEINYRRFFDVNQLAAICMEVPEVFEQTHKLIRTLIQRGHIDGLRIDHPDGLYNPSEYLKRLQQLFSDSDQQADRPADPATVQDLVLGTLSDSDCGTIARDGNSKPSHYLVVEKILGRSERIPPEWPIDGTTGYDFLNLVNGLFVDRNNVRAIDRTYGKFLRESIDFAELVYRCKKQVLDVSMSSEINVLGYRLDVLSTQNRTSRDFTMNSLTDALREVIACFPVYRTYIDQNGISEQDRQYVENSVWRAKRRNPAINSSIYDFVRDVLLLRYPANASEALRNDWLRFVGKFQQVTGPVMAKGVEDTAFYIYNRLISLNEVGGDPDKFGSTPGMFHQQNLERQANWPHSMLTLSTHDTKRSEDVRARLNVISEIPTEWQRHLVRWSRINARKKLDVDGQQAPSRNDEYLLYQTLIGTWPFGGLNSGNHASYVERIQNYMAKAVHEAKVHTSWVSPHEPYDAALAEFIANILADSNKNAFLSHFSDFATRVSQCGIWNSLSQTLLKLTCPGVPDTYQGSEIWDFSLVDPDNRRPVDFDRCHDLLVDVQTSLAGSAADRSDFLQDLLNHPHDDRLKLFIVTQVLQFRREHQELFNSGDYLPLDVSGANSEHVCAFARRSADAAMIVAVPRLISKLTNFTGHPPIGAEIWKDTRLTLPKEFFQSIFEDRFTNRSAEVVMNDGRCELSLGDLFCGFPVAFLHKCRGV